MDAITYWHVELARHSIILGEALPCESYLYTGNRAALSSGGTLANLHADFSSTVWEAQGCAELVVAGPRLAAIRHRLLPRDSHKVWQGTESDSAHYDNWQVAMVQEKACTDW